MGKAARGSGQGARYRERTYLSALRLRDEGIPVPKISKRLGPSVRTLSRWFSAASAPAKRRTLNHEDIITDLQADMEPAAVAEKHGCTVDWVYVIRKRAMGGTRRRPDERAVLRDLKSMSTGEVAAKHGCAVTTVQRIRRNAKRRGQLR